MCTRAVAVLSVASVGRLEKLELDDWEPGSWSLLEVGLLEGLRLRERLRLRCDFLSGTKVSLGPPFRTEGGVRTPFSAATGVVSIVFLLKGLFSSSAPVVP